MKTTILDLFSDTHLSNLRVEFGNIMNNRGDKQPEADPFDLMNDFLYIASDTDQPHAIILVTEYKFTRLITKMKSRLDRDMGSKEYLEMHERISTIVGAYHVVNDHYPKINFISLDEARALVTGWDEECEVSVCPVVPDDERLIVADYDDRMAKLKEKARENGSIESLESAIERLSGGKYNRLTISASYCLNEVNFLLETIQSDGSYRKEFNGGIIYRERGNEWTTHT